MSGLWPIAIILVNCSDSTYPGHVGRGCKGRPKRDPFSTYPLPTGTGNRTFLGCLLEARFQERGGMRGRVSVKPAGTEVNSSAFSKLFLLVSLCRYWL